MNPWQETQLLAQADAARQRGDHAQAMQILKRLVVANPVNAEARRALAMVMARAGSRAEAVEHMRRAIEAKPQMAEWHFDLGQMLEASQRLEEAYEAFVRAEELDGTEARYPGRLAMLNRRLRDDGSARAAAERALRLDADEPRALLALAQDLVKRGDLEEAESRARRVIGTCDEPLHRATAWHEIGRMHERREEWDEAFDAHARANAVKLSLERSRAALQQRTVPFEPSLNYVDRYAAWGEVEYGDGVPAPVVLTGFPRSGTTMAEQILASHPGLATSEERPLFIPVRLELDSIMRENMAREPGVDPLEALTEDQVRRLRGIFRNHLVDAVPEELRERVLIDKHPLRTLDLGLLNRFFPEARVIFMIRDPRDVCLSAFFQDFVVNPGMVRFFSLDLCAKWYEAVMGFWLKLRPMLSIDVLEVRYEDLVTDFDASAPRMIEMAGVEWDDGVRDFYKPAGQRVVHSASYEAVTERLNTRAIGRWKRYAGKLEPVLGVLEPFVEALGYEATGAHPEG